MANFDIDGDLIRKLAGLLDETGLTEIEFVEGEKSVRVAKSTQVMAMSAPAMQPPASLAAAPAPTTSATGPATALASHPGAVTSPMVGTAYVAPDPSSPPFARVGDQVKAGQTILIIEAMKVMNPIKAPKAGTVAQVFVSDAQPVEYGEVLMIIE